MSHFNIFSVLPQAIKKLPYNIYKTRVKTVLPKNCIYEITKSLIS